MRASYLFKNLRIVNSNEVVDGDIRVIGGRIKNLASGLTPQRNETVFDCAGMLAYPGLINAHDHLQFNLYPKIGNPPYENSYEWGKDILTNFREDVDRIEAIPIRHRYQWGAWKNLFSGVTTVIHHDPYSLHFDMRFPIGVLKRYTMAHSLGNEKDIPYSLGERRPDTPFVIHLAEGRDDVTSAEVETLRNVGGIDHRTVAVHAINISSNDINTFEQARASIVWCPSSNSFLFGKTIPREVFASKIPIALGTDSTLTGSLTLFDEMRCARSLRGCPANQLMPMVTDIPRTIFNLSPDIGRIQQDGVADFFLLPFLHADAYETLLSATPGDVLFLMRRGSIVFYDRETFPALKPEMKSRMSFNGKAKVISGNRCEKLLRRLNPFLQHYLYLSEAPW